VLPNDVDLVVQIRKASRSCWRTTTGNQIPAIHVFDEYITLRLSC